MRFIRMLPLLFLACSLKLNYDKQVYYMTSPSSWKQGVFKIHATDVLEICEADEKTCESFERSATGSGFAVETTKEKNKTHIITAAHICSTNMSPSFDLHQVSMMNLVIKEYRRDLMIDDGVTKTKAKVIAVNEAKDVCLLEMDRDVEKKFEIAKYRPEYGERIYNIGAPAGFYSAGAKFYNEGYYVGVVFAYSHFATMPFIQEVFSISAVGGLSGSPLINEDGRIVGMIHSIRTDYTRITFSCTIDDLNEIISKVE